MPVRRLPVRPDPEQLQRQAKELLRAIRGGDADAIAELRDHHPESIDPAAAKLADAQLVLARSYQTSSWTRLVQACASRTRSGAMISMTVRTLITRNPALIHEHVLIRTDSNWGPPMTYAANVGRDGIIRFLHSQGAKDLESAAGRAALQGKTGTVHLLYDLAGRPSLERLTLAGPAYTLSVEGTAVLLTLGARVAGPERCGLDHDGAPPRHRQPQSGREASHPGDVRRARLRASRHAGDGASSWAHRSARGSSRARSGSPHAHVRHHRDLPARACLRPGAVCRSGNAGPWDDAPAYRRVLRRSWRSRSGCSIAA